MTSIYEFLNGWRELITKVFGEYPLAAALMTLLAVGMFFALQTEWRREQTKSNILLAGGPLKPGFGLSGAVPEHSH